MGECPSNYRERCVSLLAKDFAAAPQGVLHAKHARGTTYDLGCPRSHANIRDLGYKPIRLNFSWTLFIYIAIPFVTLGLLDLGNADLSRSFPAFSQLHPKTCGLNGSENAWKGARPMKKICLGVPTTQVSPNVRAPRK
jgi:hypothetical protein